jgi:triphosphoribosyl-dephospho-CoA synthetase
MENLDGYLRGKGHNPGTLADITSVSIFLALLDPGN